MSSKSEDDYWFASETKAFSFEDEFSNIGDDINKETRVTDITARTKSVYISDTIPSSNYSDIPIPIHQIVANKDLEKLLDDDLKINDVAELEKWMPVEDTVKNILLNKYYDLNIYRSLQSKTDLIDAAVKTADGNCILMVVLFLMRTLKKSLVYTILSSRPIAVQQYACYLSFQLNTNELTNLLMMTGNSATLALKLFKIIVDNFSSKESSDTLLNRLQSLYNNHYKNDSSDDNDAKIMKYYLNLLEWQRTVQHQSLMNDVLGLSVNKCISLCCQNHWGEPEGHLCNPHSLAKQQCVSGQQLQWIILDVKSASQSWDDILKVFIKNNWFGSKKVINSSIPVENIFLRLGEHNAPPELLEKFLGMVDDIEKSISLAIKFKCHRHVINMYVNQKDRVSLLEYKSKMHPQSEEYFLVENALRSTNCKWKN